MVLSLGSLQGSCPEGEPGRARVRGPWAQVSSSPAVGHSPLRGSSPDLTLPQLQRHEIRAPPPTCTSAHTHPCTSEHSARHGIHAETHRCWWHIAFFSSYKPPSLSQTLLGLFSLGPLSHSRPLSPLCHGPYLVSIRQGRAFRNAKLKFSEPCLKFPQLYTVPSHMVFPRIWSLLPSPLPQHPCLPLLQAYFSLLVQVLAVGHCGLMQPVSPGWQISPTWRPTTLQGKRASCLFLCSRRQHHPWPVVYAQLNSCLMRPVLHFAASQEAERRYMDQDFFFFLRAGQRRIIFASVTVSAEWRQTPEQGGQEGSTPSKPHRGLQR